MFGYSLAFLIGISFLYCFKQLPGLMWVLGIFVFSITFFSFYFKFRQREWLLYFAIMTLGFAWVLLFANVHLKKQLPQQFQDQTITVIGRVATLPEYQNNDAHFEFLLQQILQEKQLHDLELRVRLNWYQAPMSIEVGQQWQLTVKLKKPRGFWDRGTFDYQQWLFAEKISATGYVVQGNNRLKSNYRFLSVINRTRQAISSAINTDLQNNALSGLVTALAVGVRSGISDQQWLVLQNTGTNHLFAIAGLHIGFITTLSFSLISLIWRYIPKVNLHIPARQIAAVFALSIAVFYSLLAGLSLPTRRAAIMAFIMLYSLIIRKKLSAFSALSLAMILILVFNPLVIFSESFWLSFLAVLLIIYASVNRLGGNKFWQQWGKAQWVLAFGLLPISLLFFQQTSLLNFIANFIAIPWVGFVVLPLCLLGDISWFFSLKLSAFMWILAEKALGLIWIYLGYLANLSLFQWHITMHAIWIFILAIVGIFFILAPRGLPCRSLGVIWLLPLVLWKPASPKIGEVWLSLLDVGQGLSVIINTQNHILVYDTGPRFNPNFDAGKAVIIPYLAYFGIKHLDTLMISHGDNDHIGGAQSILQQIPTKNIITSVPAKLTPYSASLCYAGQQWNWDDVQFNVLYPPYGQDNLDNDSSCVLRITTGSIHILLTGDIEQKAESYLVQHENNLLSAEILVVPHHGSDTSSTQPFVQAVSPHYVLFPTGYDNRFKFPKTAVVNRYQQIGAVIYNTANDGEIFMKLNSKGVEMIQTYYRNFWHFWDA